MPRAPARKKPGNPAWKKGVSGNPSGKRKDRTDAALSRADGWGNIYARTGALLPDKRRNIGHQCEPVGYEQAVDLIRGDHFAARVVNLLPNEMLRQGFDLRIAGEDEAKELQEVISSRWEDLGLRKALGRAARWRRGFGGAAVYLGINDGQPASAPLDLDRVQSLDFLTPFEARELRPEKRYDDPRLPRFGEVELWRLTATLDRGTGKPRQGIVVGDVDTGLIHETRLLLFPGIEVTRAQVQGVPDGWGDSVLTQFLPALHEFNSALTSAGILVADFAQAVFKLAGLKEMIAAGKDTNIVDSMKVLEQSRTSARAMMIDSNDSFERTQTPVGGLPELIDRFANRLAAAAEMPLTLLFGQSPGGLNATGESDIRFFYDQVKAAQEEHLLPHIEYVVKIIMRSLKIVEPESWSIHFRPLWQPSELEQANARYVQAQTDALYITNQVLSPEETALARFGADEYSFTTQIDWDARAALEEAAPPAVLTAGTEGEDVTAPPDDTKKLPDVDETEAELVDRADKQTRKG